MGLSKVPSIEFIPTIQVRSHLERLLATGLYGFRIEDVVERLICDKLIEMLKEPSGLNGWRNLQTGR